MASALELPPGDQTQYLERACEGSPELRAEAEALLKFREPAERFLERPIFGEPAYLLEGHKAGPYRLVRLIGKGGMSSVYLAERDDRLFAKRVAVKVISGIRPGVEAERRFRSERQILASLEHPNTARLLDAGVTAGGLAYLVMDYVEGRPILEYCSGQPLSKRLELFCGVCAAVEFAHQHLVVHRDIKPANVLVTAEGVPKLLDFGIAKILESSPGGEDAITLAHTHPMTPEYASPEQFRGEAISTATDVYALGGLLYEMLSGRRPFQLAGLTWQEAMRTVSECEPASLSTICPQISSDLVAIVEKAMYKAPSLRYGSARELSADVGRYLEGRPLVARRRSSTYLLRKFVARHRSVCAAAGAALLAASAMTIAVVRQGQIAQRRFQDVRNLAHSLIYELNDGMAAVPGSEEVRKLLVTRALGYLDPLSREAAGDIDLQMELADGYFRVGSIQGVANLGDSTGALASYAKARRILEAVIARRPSAVMPQVQLSTLLRRTAEVYTYLGQAAQARSYAEQSLRAWERLLRAFPTDARGLDGQASAEYALADAIQSAEPRLSIEYRNKALAVYERRLAAKPDDAEAQRNVALCLKSLAATLMNLGDSRNAREHFLRALDLDTRRAGLLKDAATQLDVSFDLSELGNLAKIGGDLNQALDYYERTLAIRQSLAAAAPKNARLKARAAYALLRVGELRLQRGDASKALMFLGEAQAADTELVSMNPADRVTRADLAAAWLLAADAQVRLARPADACAAYGRALHEFDELEQRSTMTGEEKNMVGKARKGVENHCHGRLVP